MRITRAYDERKKVVGLPKTDMGVRTVSIPATLIPLLGRIVRDGRGEDRVCPIVAATPEKTRAGIYREYLEAASIDAPEFFVETATHLIIDFRSLRDSGITWRFLAGHRAELVQREAGHEHISTTLAYAKEVQDRGNRYGEPFPPLPSELTGGPSPNGEPGAKGFRSRGGTKTGRREGIDRLDDVDSRGHVPPCAATRGAVNEDQIASVRDVEGEVARAKAHRTLASTHGRSVHQSVHTKTKKTGPS